MVNHENFMVKMIKLDLKRSNLCDYSDNGTITLDGEGDDYAAKLLHERNKGVISKNCVSFTECIGNINNTQIDNTNDIDVVMSMYNLIENSDNYSKISGSLQQYYRDHPNDNITQSESFRSKIKITGKTPADCNKKNVEIVMPSKYLINFWRTLEMSLINCKISLSLTQSENYVVSSTTGKTKFAITVRSPFMDNIWGPDLEICNW